MRGKFFRLAFALVVLLALALPAGAADTNFSSLVTDTSITAGTSVTATTSVVAGTSVAAGTTVAAGTSMASGTTITSGTKTIVGTFLLTTPATVITATNGFTLTATGTYQPLAAAGAVGFSAITAAPAGTWLFLTNTSNQTITITDTSTTMLSGNAALAQYDTILLVSDGTNWLQAVPEGDN